MACSSPAAALLKSPPTALQLLLEEINFQRTKEMRQLLKDGKKPVGFFFPFENLAHRKKHDGWRVSIFHNLDFSSCARGWGLMNGKISPLRRTGEFVLSSRSLYGFTFFSPADLYLPAKGTLKFCDAVITECGVSCFMLVRSEKPAGDRQCCRCWF